MIITISNTQLDCKEDGTIFRMMKSGKWKEIPNNSNQIKKYNVILIEKKQYMRSHIIAHAFLGYSLRNKYNLIYHKDLNKLNCAVDNLEFKIIKEKKETKKESKLKKIKEVKEEEENIPDDWE